MVYKHVLLAKTLLVVKFLLFNSDQKNLAKIFL